MKFRLGGEMYENISYLAFTPAYDLYVHQVLDEAGVIDMLEEQAKLPAHLAEPTGRVFVRQLAYAGNVSKLLAAFMQPAGGRWSVSWAMETATKLDKITSPPEKQILNAILTKGVNDFFRRGRRSSKTFH